LKIFFTTIGMYFEADWSF